MSLYNMLHGVNPMAQVLLAALGIDRGDVPRFRDCYWNGEHICIYTRTGGGNREDYESENTALTLRDGYVRDEDDEFDSTYATFYFAPSPKLKDALTAVPAADATPAQKWESLFTRLQSGVDDPQIARAKEAFEPFFREIAKALSVDAVDPVGEKVTD